MYVRVLCTDCKKGPFHCGTKNCDEDIDIPKLESYTMTSTNDTESTDFEWVIAEPIEPTYFEHFLYLS